MTSPQLHRALAAERRADIVRRSCCRPVTTFLGRRRPRAVVRASCCA